MLKAGSQVHDCPLSKILSRFCFGPAPSTQAGNILGNGVVAPVRLLSDLDLDDIEAGMLLLLQH